MGIAFNPADYEDANQNPVAAINGDKTETIVHLRVLPGQEVKLDASASIDPDGDELDFCWWIYAEAGTYPGEVALTDESTIVANLTIPEDAAGSELHTILTVRDLSDIVPMVDYRRVVITVIAANN